MSGLYLQRKREFGVSRWLFWVLLVAMLAIVTWYGYVWYTKGEKPPIIPLPASALADPSTDESPVTDEALESYKVEPTHPRYLSIPSLGIAKARVQSVGLTKYNTLDMPSNINDTAWYNEGAYPGQGYGSVLIDGHNIGVSHNGVFANLDNLKNGDEIIIERGDGKIFKYAVVENQTESIREANVSGMKRLLTPFEPAKEGLGIITDAGNWVPRDKVFDKRILVRAVAEE
jgi:hypothetical protein